MGTSARGCRLLPGGPAAQGLHRHKDAKRAYAGHPSPEGLGGKLEGPAKKNRMTKLQLRDEKLPRLDTRRRLSQFKSDQAVVDFN